MGDELKSAVELAMERLEREGMKVEELTSRQKEEIGEIRMRFQARIEEAEFSAQSRLQEAQAKGDQEVLEKIQQDRLHEKERLRIEMERRVEEVRKKVR